MAFDGIVTKSVVSELNNILIGARVNKVFEPSKTEIVLSLYNNGINYLLTINIHPENYRLHLTKYSKKNPVNAMNYCMLLRKYLIGFKISSIKSFDLERLVKIHFEGNNELHDNVSYTLIAELMGRRSNIVLLNNKNVIIDSLKHIITSTREILPARPYEYPELFKTSLLELENFDSFYRLVSNTSYTDISVCLSDLFIGFSTVFVNNILNELSIENSTHDINDLKEIYEYIINLLNNLGTDNVSFKKISNKDYTIDFSKQNNLINYELDDFYYKKESTDEFEIKKSHLLKIILSSLKKCSKKLENINHKLAECENMDKYRLYGELLTANLYKFKNVYETPSEIELENYYDNNNLVKIKLDTTCSIQKNMEKFFKKYNKLKNTLSVVTYQKKEAELELRYIESIIYSLDSVTSIEDLREIHDEFIENVSIKKISYKNLKVSKPKEKEEVHLNKYNINGFDVYVGKNNKQNDYLTLHFAQKNDLWFHVQAFHGCHVVLKTNGKEPDEDTIFKCALLAKQNSKASLDKNVSIDYTYIKYVRKAPGQKPGMVNYTNYKTIIL